jgi:hypothetical protein
MVLRKPRNLAGGGGDVDVLQYEILQEKAAVLARLGRKLQAALDRLAEFDAAARPGSAQERDALVAAAGEALWYFVAQREVLGIPDTEGMMRQLGVPREVRLRMGLDRRAADRSP